MPVHSMFGILILATLASGPVQGADFFSSLDQDSRTSACPDETVTYVCIVPDPTGGSRATQWSGSILQGQCLTNQTTLSHELFIVNGMETGTCGDLTAQIVNQIGSGSDAEFNSTLPVTATADLDGRTVVCSGPGAMVGQFVEIGSATLTLASVPAPNITVTELTPVSVRVSVTDYPEETLNCVLTFTVEGTAPGGAVSLLTSNTLTVHVPGLNLCTNNYTFNASVSIGSESAGSMPVEFSSNLPTLVCDTNLFCDGMCDDNPQTLLWDAPTLGLRCNVAYEIEVDGVLTTTTMGTSISVADLDLPVPPCVYTVTVTPILTDRIGLLERCSSQVTITLTEGFPSPTITSVDFVYRQQDIMVTINWQGEVATLIDVVMVECSMEVCQPVSLTNPMGTYSTNLDYSGVIGGSVDFTVSFINDPCVTTTATTTTNFRSVLESARVIRTDTTSADILVVYNNDVMLEGTFVLRATIMERVTGERIQMSGTFSPPSTIGTENQFVFMFTGLTEGATYEFEVRVENGLGQTIGRAESGSFTAWQLGEPSSSSSTAAIGGAVGAVVVIVLVVLVVNLVLIVLLSRGLLSCCLVIPSVVQADKGPTSDAFDDKENRAYKIRPCVLFLLVMLMITLPFVIYFYCCWRKKSGSPKTDDKVELNVRTGSESEDTLSSPEAGGGGNLNYAVPSDIKREEYPGTHEEYTVVDKSRKKPNKKGSQKQENTQPPPQEAALMYSEVDKCKKQPGNAAYGVAGKNSELDNIPLQPNDAYGSNVVRRHRELDNIPIEPYEQVSQNIAYGIARRHTEADYIPTEPNDAYEAYNQRTDT